MNIMKCIIKIVATFFAVIVILLIAGIIYIDTVAKTAIEKGATYAMGVETTVEDADIGLLSGTSSLSGLNIANPPGYTSPHLLNMKNSSVQVNYSALRGEVVRIPSMTMSGLDLYIEKRKGKSNIDVVIENLQRFESAEKPADDAGGTRFIFDEIIITDIMVHTSLLPIGGELAKVELPIDEIRLTNIGSDSDQGMVLGQLTNVIFKAILAAIIHNGVNLPGDLLADLTNGLGGLKPLGDLGIGVLTGTGDLIQGIAGGVQDVLDGVGKGLDDLGKGIGEGLGNLLGGDKKK